MLQKKLIDNFESLSDDKKQKRDKQDKEDLDIIDKVVNENAKAWEVLAK